MGCKSPTLLDTIQMEVENVSPEEIIGPLSELKDGEVVVGEIHDTELRKIFGIAMHWKQVASEIKEEAERIDDPDLRQEHLLEGLAIFKKSKRR